MSVILLMSPDLVADASQPVEIIRGCELPHSRYGSLANSLKRLSLRELPGLRPRPASFSFSISLWLLLRALFISLCVRGLTTII